MSVEISQHPTYPLPSATTTATICFCYEPTPLAMQVDESDDIQEIEISPPPQEAIPPIEVIWEDDKIEKVRIEFRLECSKRRLDWSIIPNAQAPCPVL